VVERNLKKLLIKFLHFYIVVYGMLYLFELVLCSLTVTFC